MSTVSELKKTVSQFREESAGIERSIAAAKAQLEGLRTQPVSIEEFKQAVLDMVEAKATKYQERLASLIRTKQFEDKLDRESSEYVKFPVRFDLIDFLASEKSTNPIGLFKGAEKDESLFEAAMCFYFGDTLKEKLTSVMDGMNLAWPEGTEVGSDRATRREEIRQVNETISELEAQKDAADSARHKLIGELREIV